jgi:hypothetical protein
VSSSCSTSYTCRVNLVANRWSVMNEERNGKCLPQVEHIRRPLWHRYSIAVKEVMVATLRFRSEASTELRGTLGSVASLLAQTLYQGNLDI